MKKIIILMVVLLVVSVGIGWSEEGFKGIPWGSAPEEVEAQIGEDLFLFKGNNDSLGDPMRWIEGPSEFAGYEAYTFYSFSRESDRLTMVTMLIERDVYDTFRGLFRTMDGEPVIDNYWEGTFWDRGDTRMMLQYDPMGPMTIVTYMDREYVLERLAEAREKQLGDL